MKGAEVLVRLSAAAGVDVCFANPGTTEMAMVDALTRLQVMRPVLALFEGVASGAADGYARVAGKPAAVMLHLGPGLGNATANLHNARRGQSPVVCWVGDHASWIRTYDPPLTSDIEAIARGSSQWIRTVGSVENLPRDTLAAIIAALGPRAGVATLIVPADVQDAEVAPSVALPDPGGVAPRPKPLDRAEIESVAVALRRAKNPLLLLGGPVGDARALSTAARLAQAAGGALLLEQFPRLLRREPGLPAPDRMGYLPFQARAQLAAHDLVVLFGADDPVCFFGYPGEAPRLVAEATQVVDPARGGRDPLAALLALAESFELPERPSDIAERRESSEVTGHLQPETLCRILANRLPEDAIVVDEGITSTLPLYPTLRGAAPHDYLACKGGSIGFCLPAATGAAIAAPGRRVIAYSGDGSALYTIQALWTQAREGLAVTNIICVNKKYAVLQMELMRAGGALEGAGKSLTEIDAPDVDFVALAKGFGVMAREARDLRAFEAALEESLSTPGPSLIAAVFG